MTKRLVDSRYVAVRCWTVALCLGVVSAAIWTDWNAMAAKSLDSENRASTASLAQKADVALNDFEGKVVREILWEGLKRIEKDAVNAKISTRIGGALSPQILRSDLQAIYGMAYFEDVSVHAEALDGDPTGVRLTYGVRERAVISELVFEGNEQIETSDLKEIIKVKE